MKVLITLVTALFASLASAGHATQLPANKLAARQDAAALVASLRLPSGATRLAGKPADISSFGVSDQGKWTSGNAPKTVIAYIRSHPPAGGKLQSWGSGGDSLTLWYDWPSVRQELYGRSLRIDVVTPPHGNSTIVATSQSDWIVPRPASERVPSGVSVVDVTLRVGGGTFGTTHPVTTRHVFTDTATVDSLVSRIDALTTVQPGLIYGCPLELAGPARPLLTLVFRAGAAAPALARAEVGVHRGKDGGSGWTSCDPIDFWVDGRQQQPLTSQSFVRQIARLIGADIS